MTGPELAKSFDGSATTAPAGRTIASYQWDFGDGATATGATANHTYAEPGTYSVTLTVKDSANFTASSTQTVTATPPHQAPVAAFTPTVTGLTAAFDASASTASGAASITGYAWDFGDGQTSDGGRSVAHVCRCGHVHDDADGDRQPGLLQHGGDAPK